MQRLRRLGLSFRAIGAQIGARESQVWGVIKRLEGRAEGSNRKNKVAADLLKESGKVEVPLAVLDERDRRLSVEMTLSMKLFGDPVVPRWQSNASR